MRSPNERFVVRNGARDPIVVSAPPVRIVTTNHARSVICLPAAPTTGDEADKAAAELLLG